MPRIFFDIRDDYGFHFSGGRTTDPLTKRNVEAAEASLIRAGVQIRTAKELVSVSGREASLACIYTGEVERVTFGSILLLTARLPEDGLYQALVAREAEFADRGIAAVHRIGDCLAPATIAAAVFSGHELAVTVDRPSNAAIPFMRERIHLTQ